MGSNHSHNSPEARAELRRAALEYHEFPTPGKVAISATKQLVNQHDLALAYSPGVAAPCEEIVKDPNAAYKYTSKGNLVAVISNGTAVLGLGDIGPLASKPVMEGKGVLFKKFAGIDVFDLEIEEKNLDKLVDIIAALEPTFGGINLEDIKAPDCFYVERKLRERMKKPLLTWEEDERHGEALRGLYPAHLLRRAAQRQLLLGHPPRVALHHLDGCPVLGQQVVHRGADVYLPRPGLSHDARSLPLALEVRHVTPA